MEELIHEEILQLFNKLDNQINLPLSMSLIYNVSVVNALWTLLNGTRLSLDDPALHNLLQKIDAMVKEAGQATILNVVPSIRQGFLKSYFSANHTTISKKLYPKVYTSKERPVPVENEFHLRLKKLSENKQIYSIHMMGSSDSFTNFEFRIYDFF